jgi:hypothetical protein
MPAEPREDVWKSLRRHHAELMALRAPAKAREAEALARERRKAFRVLKGGRDDA